MTPWGSSASTLEDTNHGTTAITEGELGSNYFWPVWRFGRVLQPVGAESLPVADAQLIGSLFDPGRPAATRYLVERTPQLRDAAVHAGGTYLRDWPAHLRYASEPFDDLEKTWHPEEILVTYSFVPIVRLPRFVVELGEGAWQVRESLTICGTPAKSKVWLTASLIAYRGEPADTIPLCGLDLSDARRAFEPFVQDSLASLTAYYQTLLNVDTKSLALDKPLHVRALEQVAETEIVSLASRVDLGETFDFLEDKGWKEFRLAAERNLFPGAMEVLDFLAWTDSFEIQSSIEARSSRPKILAIYAEEPACGSVRALVMPRIDAEKNRTRYSALAERRQPERPVTCFPLSESVGRFLASEYGRFF